MKNFKIYVGAVALFALVAVNVWNAATTLKGSELRVDDVEAMANTESLEGMITQWYEKGGSATSSDGMTITIKRKMKCVKVDTEQNERCIPGAKKTITITIPLSQYFGQNQAPRRNPPSSTWSNN